MHNQLDAIADKGTLDCDLCVIGTGPAGLAVVSKLLNAGKKVIVLESGAIDPLPEHQDFNKGESIGPRDLNLTGSRLRCFGGAGKLWAGVCRPMSELDFQKRDHVPYSGWPIQFKELTRFYKEAAQMLELDYEAFYDERWKTAAHAGAAFDDFHRPDSLLHGLWFQQAGTTQKDISNKFKQQIMESVHVHLITDATVVDLDSDQNSKVNRVVAKSILGKQLTIQPQMVVLATGAIENPRILLNASLNKKLAPNPFLGTCFMSHPGFPNVGQVVKNNTSKCLEETNNGWNRFFNFEVKDQEQTKKQILRHGISLSPISIKKELHKAIYDSKTSVGDFFGNLKILDLFNQMKCKITGDEFTPQYWKVSVGIEQEPLLENKVSLSEKTDMHQKQRVQVYWGAVSKTERSTVKEAVKVLGRELGLTSSGLAKLNEETVNETVFETQDPVNHHIGTTRMAAFENEGVVDAQLEHFQVRNLFIAGSSVFPTSSIVNPTFTIFALSLRLGEEILNRLNKNTYYV